MADEGCTGSERIPPWLFNLGLFGLLIGLVLVYAFVAVRQTQEDFLGAVRDHARLTATLVERQASGAVLARQVTDEILYAFLGNAGRFVAYLDGVEPFNADELAAYVAQAGLAGIRIDRPGGRLEAQPGRLPNTEGQCEAAAGLSHNESSHLASFTLPGEVVGVCITVGVETERLDHWQAELGLDHVLTAVAKVPGIRGTRILPASKQGSVGEPRLREESAGGSVEVRTPFGDSFLALELDAGNLLRRRERVWRDFVAFSLLLAVTGGLLSFLLYRRQIGHLQRVRELERRLSQEREEANLGRAAAAIAHEIRNPLNAMSLGLQRLQWEAEELTADHRDLVGVVLDALRRANGSVTGLLDYARPLRLNAVPVSLSELTEAALKPSGRLCPGRYRGAEKSWRW